MSRTSLISVLVALVALTILFASVADASYWESAVRVVLASHTDPGLWM